jgi:hypothetical protein
MYTPAIDTYPVLLAFEPELAGGTFSNDRFIVYRWAGDISPAHSFRATQTVYRHPGS